MNQLKILLAFLLLINLKISAQDYLPFASSNYAGVTGVILQPASIADSRYGFDMTISGTNFSIANTFYGIDPYVLKHPKSLKDFDFQGPDISRNMDGNSKSGIFHFRQDMFAFMLTLSDKSAIAFTPSIRSVTNIDNMTQNLAVLIDKLNTEPDLWDIRLKNENVYAQTNTWVEYGLTYARVLLNNKAHFMKAGATVKINQGIGSAYMLMKDLNYEVDANDTVSFYNSYTNYGASESFGKEDYKYHFDANPSFSFDFGFVYEFRPDWMDYQYNMDGKSGLMRMDEDKYLFRLGFSITDVGNVRYKRSPLSRDFNADIRNLYVGDMDISNIPDLNAIIDSNFTYFDVPEKYNMTLPICASMQADLRVAKGFYLNFTPYLAFNKGIKNVNKVHYISAFNIVPRYDRKWFGVSLPIHYNAYKQWNIGLGMRIGSLWVGSNDILSLLVSSKDRYGSALSVAMKLPVPIRHPRDRDNDNVSDKKDKCPSVPGLFELKGCPDADGDGITDEKDECPDEAGIIEFNGCPDMDGDGIMDKNDSCAEVAGLIKYNGCPDSDGDSIIDQNDACPFNAGSVEMAGCPDQDNDGLPDKDDNCPTVAGTTENGGCPFIDSDEDGIKDETDNCPKQKGPVENKGCPYPDTDGDSIPDKDDDCPSIAGKAAFKGCPDSDGDGISDKQDICPTIPGIAQNGGCPEIKKEEQEILNNAFSNLEFESGRSLIRATSNPSLDNLAAVMKKRSDFKLLLAGHTDDVGKPESNLTLSKNRTMAVKNYLVKKGIDPERIRTEWYGQTKPVAENTTPEGRQLNRRVEMNIFFE